jgi:hypothetical protein
LLEQNVWFARSDTLTSWQHALGKQHTEWMVAKFLEHLRCRYGQGKAGRTGSKPSLLHALTSVAAIPSIEMCAKPLVQLCVHGCLHWLLLDQDSQLQQLALAVLGKCKKTFPSVSACEASLKRLCDDYTFHHELLSLSVQTSGHDDSQTEGDNLGLVLHANRDVMMPIILRILFSKATKRGKAVDKHSSQHSRR